MQQVIVEKKSEVLEKLVRDRRGRLFRVRFVVVERDGTLRGKVISCEQIGDLPSFPRRGMKGVVAKDKKGFYLPIWRLPHAVKDKGLRIKDFYSSPYFNKFDFLTVIKIRAPARSV